MKSTSADCSSPQPLSAPPAISAPIQRVVIPSSSEVHLPTEPSLVTPVEPKSDSSMSGKKEKVGRWSEQEHLVFLDGLQQYGKQWKMIAGMIGTRTVVQVRTHAQKYFQKMERKGMAVEDRPAKRKSLPPSLPSRSPKKSRKGSTSKRLSLGLDNIGSASAMINQAGPEELTSGGPGDLTSHPSYISKSSSSTHSENWSTKSPNNVADLDLLNPVDRLALGIETDDIPHESFENILGEDPLEWLIETETQQLLPESSLPYFPDLKEDKVVCATTKEESPVEKSLDPPPAIKEEFEEEVPVIKEEEVVDDDDDDDAVLNMIVSDEAVHHMVDTEDETGWLLAATAD